MLYAAAPSPAKCRTPLSAARCGFSNAAAVGMMATRGCGRPVNASKAVSIVAHAGRNSSPPTNKILRAIAINSTAPPETRLPPFRHWRDGGPPVPAPDQKIGAQKDV